MVLTMRCARYDETRGKHVRTPLPNLLMVTRADCKVGVVCFCAAFKNLLIKCFHANIEIIAITASQDMSVLARDGTKEAWPDSIGLPSSMRTCRKFDDGSVGKKIRNKDDVKNMQRRADFLLRCKTSDMKNMFSKLMVSNWTNAKKEHNWTKSFSSALEGVLTLIFNYANYMHS